MQNTKIKLTQTIAWIKAKKIRMAAAVAVFVVIIGGAGYALTRPAPSKIIRTEETGQSEVQKTISVVSEPASAQIETTSCNTKEPKQSAPFTCKAEPGTEVSLTAITSYTYENKTYTFDQWEGCDRAEGVACYITVSDSTPPEAKAIYKNEVAKTPTPKPGIPQSQPVALCSKPTALGGSHVCTITITAAPTNYSLKASLSGHTPHRPIDWFSSFSSECTSSSHCAVTPTNATTEASVLITALEPTMLKLTARDYITSYECVGIGCPNQRPVDQFRFAGFGSDQASRTITFKYEFMCNWSGNPAPNCNSL